MSDAEPWDGRTCPPCQGSGRLTVGATGECAYAVVECPFCGGDGLAGQGRLLARLSRCFEQEAP